MLERQEAPQLQPDNGAGNRRSKTADRQSLRPTGCQEEPRPPERNDVRFHSMQTLIRRLLQFDHARMEVGHLFRETLLTLKCTVDSLVRIVNPLVQSLNGYQDVAHSSAAAV